MQEGSQQLSQNNQSNGVLIVTILDRLTYQFIHSIDAGFNLVLLPSLKWINMCQKFL